VTVASFVFRVAITSVVPRRFRTEAASPNIPTCWSKEGGVGGVRLRFRGNSTSWVVRSVHFSFNVHQIPEATVKSRQALGYIWFPDLLWTTKLNKLLDIEFPSRFTQLGTWPGPWPVRKKLIRTNLWSCKTSAVLLVRVPSSGREVVLQACHQEFSRHTVNKKTNI